MSKTNLNKNIKTLYNSKYINIFEQKYFRTKSLFTDNYNDSYNNLFFIYKIINVLTQMSMEQDLSIIYNYVAEKTKTIKDEIISEEIFKLYINKCYNDAIYKFYNIKSIEYTKNNNEIVNISKEERDIDTNIINNLNQMNNQYFHNKYIEYLNNNTITINKNFIDNINNINPSDIIDTLIQNQNERFILDTLILKSKNNKNNTYYNKMDYEKVWFNYINEIRFKIHKNIPDIINKIKFNHKVANNKIINNHNNPKRNVSNNKYDKWENNKYHKQITYNNLCSQYFGSEDIDLKNNVFNNNQILNWQYKNNNNNKINIYSDIKFYLKYNYINDDDTIRNNIDHDKNENIDVNINSKDNKNKLRRNNESNKIKIIKYYQDKHYNNWYKYYEE